MFVTAFFYIEKESDRMEYLVTKEQMKQIEDRAMNQIKIPSILLMEQAAMGILEEMEKEEQIQNKIFILCGMGNNGADGLALARLLHQKGYLSVMIGIVGQEEKGTKEWQIQYEMIKNLKIEYVIGTDWIKDMNFSNYDCIVDGLFGIGLSRELKGNYFEIVHKINKVGNKVYAIDIPSGICSNTGKVLGIGIKAYKTITFEYEKIGCMLYPGAEYSGNIVVKHIGIPTYISNNFPFSYYTYSLSKTIHTLLPKRASYSNKGTFGKVVVFAGSKNMAGAAYLSGRAAYEMGAGLVQIVTCDSNREIIQTLLPEAILTTYDPEDISWEEISHAIDWADVIVIGPGLSVKNYAKQLLQFVLNNSKVPIVIDADGLNILSENSSLIKKCNSQIIFTPHLKEFSRLVKKDLEEMKKDLFTSIQSFLDNSNHILVCKDARTIVGRNGTPFYINQSGNHGMATGGSGDVLTGMIAGLIAQGLSLEDGAVVGVYLHGLAGNSACKEKGAYSMKATDILNHISKITNVC